MKCTQMKAVDQYFPEVLSICYAVHGYSNFSKHIVGLSQMKAFERSTFLRCQYLYIILSEGGSNFQVCG